MTQSNVSIDKIAEFNALFLSLNDKGQEAALTILKSLGFAQSVMSSHEVACHCEPKPKRHKKSLPAAERL
ncbi:hypothetical protein D7Y09_13980 [bacterium 1XD42-1]|nr:hypothetical protein D7X25_14320 [bacterium 1XD42-8]RKJ62309.1 hypothetical protein D7Y09_13980 [bacterium 1XD42-1]